MTLTRSKVLHSNVGAGFLVEKIYNILTRTISGRSTAVVVICFTERERERVKKKKLNPPGKNGFSYVNMMT